MKRTELLIIVTAGLLASIAWFLTDLYSEAQYALFFGGSVLVAAAWIWLSRRTPAVLIGWKQQVLVVAVSAVVYGCTSGTDSLRWAALLWVPWAASWGYRWVRGRSEAALRAASGICGVLIILNLFALAESLYTAGLWFVYDTQVLDTLLSPVLSLAGIVHQRASQWLVLFDGRGYTPFHFGPERAHLIWAIRYVLGYYVLYRLYTGTGPGLRGTLRAGLHGLLGCLAWMIGSLLAFNFSKNACVFLNPVLLIGLPLAGLALLIPFVSRSVQAARESVYVAGGRFSLGRGLAIAAVVLICVFCGWYPWGAPKANTAVLIDDTHSKWEWSDKPFDFSDEGMSKPSAYSYTNFVDYLRHFYPVDINKDKTLDQCDLSKYSVIILKTATKEYSPREVACVQRFVRNGGGLWLHSDHTDLFGMSSHFNAILKDAGIQFNLDDQAAYDGSPSLHVPATTWFGHPTVERVRKFQFLTSCTLAPQSLLVEPVLASHRIFSENARYGRPGFFGNMLPDGNERLGTFLQGAVMPYGKGRISLFCDSTVFSNFAAFQGDYMKYALDTVSYLQRLNTGWRQLVGAAAMAALALAAGVALQAMWRRRRLEPFGTIAYDIGAAFVAGTLLVAALSHGDRPEIRSIQPLRPIAVVLENATNRDVLTATAVTTEMKDVDFGAFIMALQRAGYFPEVCRDIQEALRTSNRIVVVNPDRQPSQREMQTLYHAVGMHGYRVVVLDSIGNHGSTADELLAGFGMRRTLRAGGVGGQRDEAAAAGRRRRRPCLHAGQHRRLHAIAGHPADADRPPGRLQRRQHDDRRRRARVRG